MIKFFRKIRQNLLIENKTGKYFKYAIGEIILVVIGILIALSINNWNQNRINTGKQEDYFLGLKNDLENQILIFNSLVQFNDYIIGEGESILRDFSATSKFSEIDSINSKLTTMMYTQEYPDISTSFNELNSTGQFNLIKEKSIRSQIIKYYQDSKHLQNSMDGNRNEVIYPQVFPIIKSMVIIHQENFGVMNNGINLMDNLKSTFDNNFNDSTKEFELVNAINLRVIIAKNDNGIIGNAKNRAELLLEAVNNQLKIN